MVVVLVGRERAGRLDGGSTGWEGAEWWRRLGGREWDGWMVA